MKALLIIPYARDTAARNMALDSAMLATGRQMGLAFWRSYGWTEPAITFGYSQKWEWVWNAMQPFTGTAIRRMTGGGIVDHRRDFTYALTLPPDHSHYRQPALELYDAFHACIVAALQQAGMETEQAPCPGPCGRGVTQAAGLCFQQAEPFDVVDPASGRKIAGAAMKRTGDGVLIQGSMSVESMDPETVESFRESVWQHIADWLELAPSPMTDTLAPDALEEAVARFSSASWNQKR